MCTLGPIFKGGTCLSETKSYIWSNLSYGSDQLYSFYLLLGIVDKLITEVERGVLTSRKAGKKFMDNFLKKVKSLW